MRKKINNYNKIRIILKYREWIYWKKYIMKMNKETNLLVFQSNKTYNRYNNQTHLVHLHTPHYQLCSLPTTIVNISLLNLHNHHHQPYNIIHLLLLLTINLLFLLFLHLLLHIRVFIWLLHHLIKYNFQTRNYNSNNKLIKKWEIS